MRWNKSKLWKLRVVSSNADLLVSGKPSVSSGPQCSHLYNGNLRLEWELPYKTHSPKPVQCSVHCGIPVSAVHRVGYLGDWGFPGTLSTAFGGRCQWLNPRVPEVDTAEEQGTERLLKTGLTWYLQGQNKARLSKHQQPRLQNGTDWSGGLGLATKMPLESL